MLQLEEERVDELKEPLRLVAREAEGSDPIRAQRPELLAKVGRDACEGGFGLGHQLGDKGESGLGLGTE